jgi:hypothetical protein
MRDKRTPGSRQPNDRLDELSPWSSDPANDNGQHDDSYDFADEATTLYQRELRQPAKSARRPSARYRPQQQAKDEPRFGIEGSLPRSLRPGQSERGRNYGAVLAGLLVIGLGTMWAMRGPAWSRAMLSISAYGASIANTRASLGHGHVVEPQPISPVVPDAPPIAAADLIAAPALAAPELMEFDLADVLLDTRAGSKAEARAKRAQRQAALKAKRAKKAAAVAKPIEPLVEDEQEYQEPVYYRAAVNEGTLQVNSRPWSRILVDGQFMGHTPQRALRLAVGRHRVLLVNDELDMNKFFEITIEPGEVVTRVEVLDESAHSSR